MKLSREPARWISLGTNAIAALVVLGVINLTADQTTALGNLVVAAVLVFFGGAAGEVIRGKVSPISEEESTYVAQERPMAHRRG